MSYSREQLTQFRMAFASLSVIGPEWNLSDWPDRITSITSKREAQRKERLVTAFGVTMSLTNMARYHGITDQALRLRISRRDLSDSNVEAALGGGSGRMG